MSVHAGRYDVAVIGAGPAGSAAALCLARTGRSVALLERSSFDEPRVGENLPPEISPVLRDLGLWEVFLKQRYLPVSGVTMRWGSTNEEYSDFITNPLGCGWAIDRRRFDLMLAHGAERAGAKLFVGCNVVQCSAGDDDWRIMTKVAPRDRSVTFTSRLLVNATGRLGHLNGLPSGHIKHGTLLAAFKYGPFLRDAATCSRLYLESTSDGWWYASSVPDGRAIIAHVTDVDLLAGDLRSRERTWHNRFDQTNLIRFQSAVQFDCPLQIKPAFNSQALHSAGPRWISIGDAACAVDPLSGRGVLQALETGQKVPDLLDGWLFSEKKVELYTRNIEKVYQDAVLMSIAHYQTASETFSSPFWNRRAKNSPTSLQ